MQLFSWAILTWTDPESSPALERCRMHHPGNSPSHCVFLVCVSADTHWLCFSPLGPLPILHFCSLVFEEDVVLPVRWVKVELVVSCSGLPLQTELTGGSDRTWGRQWDTLLKIWSPGSRLTVTLLVQLSLLTCGSVLDSPPSSYWLPELGKQCILVQLGVFPLDSEEPRGHGYCGLPIETRIGWMYWYLYAGATYKKDEPFREV